MSITLRLLFGFFVIVGVAAWFVLNVFVEEVKPGVRQTMEDALVDTANLLAELALNQQQHGEINVPAFSAAFTHYRQRQPQATIWGFKKDSLELRVYITNAQGIVIYDSQGLALGQNYARWNDVYLTLNGRYGVRSTKDDPKDDRSSVMHVAAPIQHQGKLLGVLTVAKPTLSVQPFIDRSISRIKQAGWWLMGSALLIGLLITFWLNRAIARLAHYAQSLSIGRSVPAPKTYSQELDALGLILADMRAKLDGREYVENYVHHLVHEMKSPLSAMIGAAELLDDKMPAPTRQNFIQSIHQQSIRLRDMLDKLLSLAKIEHLYQLDKIELIDLHQLIEQVIQDHQLALNQRQINCLNQVTNNVHLNGDPFLLRQAISNLLDNAIDFSHAKQSIELSAEQTQNEIKLNIRDYGQGIPDYALTRIFERFYSLPRPDNRPKSTGLGLPFVKEVISLHNGHIEVLNQEDGGVLITLHFKLAPQ